MIQTKLPRPQVVDKLLSIGGFVPEVAAAVEITLWKFNIALEHDNFSVLTNL